MANNTFSESKKQALRYKAFLSYADAADGMLAPTPRVLAKGERLACLESFHGMAR